VDTLFREGILKRDKNLLKRLNHWKSAGAAMLLLECVPNDLSKEITSLLKIPVIGIGAGPETDGQIMVIHDLLGITCLEKPPKFVKDFLKGLFIC
jgi:3-methyl-2-oxobutanoate hydroxymethyltransferase